MVRRRTEVLPDSGETVQIRGLILGEINRISDQPSIRQSLYQIALSLEDPTTNQHIYNPNVLEDIQEIEAFSPRDGMHIVEVSNELSGLGKKAEEQGKENYSETEAKSSPTSSPSESGYLSAA